MNGIHLSEKMRVASAVQAVVTQVFLQYVELMRKVQITYWCTD